MTLHRVPRRGRVRPRAADHRPVGRSSRLRRCVRPRREPRHRRRADRLRVRHRRRPRRRRGAACCRRAPAIERVGERCTNRAITRLIVDQRSAGLHARVAVRNTGGADVTQTVRVDVDGVTAASHGRRARLPASSRCRVRPARRRPRRGVPRGRGPARDRRPRRRGRPPASPICACCSPATAVLGGAARIDPRRDRRVGRASRRPPTATTWRSTAASTCRPTRGRRSSPSPRRPASPAGRRRSRRSAAITVDGSVERRRSRSSAPTTPARRASTSPTWRSPPPSRSTPATPRCSSPARTPRCSLRGIHAGQRFAYLTFDLRDSNLGVQLAFPLLAERLVSQLTGHGRRGGRSTVGDRLPVRGRRRRGHRPRRRARTTVDAGRPAPPRATATRVLDDRAPTAAPTWSWRSTRRLERATLAPATASTPPAAQRPAATPPSEGDVAAARGSCGRCSPSSPSSCSWRGAASASAAGSGASRSPLRAVVAALARRRARATPSCAAPPTASRPCSSSTRSASVGAPGSDATPAVRRRRARATARTALAGVVVFGADARVDQVDRRRRHVRRPDRGRRPAATDIAGRPAARRRGAARATPAGASCSSATAGRRPATSATRSRRSSGAASRSTSSRSDGRPSPTPPIAGRRPAAPRSRRRDRARGRPRRARDRATAARVVLRRDGVEVGRQTGRARARATTRCAFEDDPGADAGAVLRYEATVTVGRRHARRERRRLRRRPGRGPGPRARGRGRGRRGRRRSSPRSTAGGVGTEVVSLGDIPDLQELVTYAGVVLVNVDARDAHAASRSTASPRRSATSGADS